MERIKIVQVKHPNCGVTYVFEVPNDQELAPGNLVLCETKRNPVEIGQCITPSFEVTDFQLKQIYGLEKNNLKSVVGRLTPEMFILERRVEK